MKIRAIDVANFRTLATFSLELAGSSAILIGENGSGKSSLLSALARALGVERHFSKLDFGNLDHPIEITVLLDELTESETSELCEAVTFDEPPTLTLGVRATWDGDNEEVEVIHGLPAKSWRKTKPDERAAIPVVSLGASRDAVRMLSFGVRRNVLGKLLEEEDFDSDVVAARELIAEATSRLGAAKAISEILRNANAALSRMVPSPESSDLSVEHAASTDRELLAQLEICTTAGTGPLPLRHESSGLGQLAVFAFLLELASRQQGTIMLIDEPELSLHPQAQRALMAALQENSQAIVATHSSSLLDRADPRTVHRMSVSGGTTTSCSPSSVSDADARRLARFTNPQTAEGFFARTVILVEGVSDKLALEAAAELSGVSLDGKGVSIVSVDGGNTLRMYLRLFGGEGFGLDLVGMCDEDKEGVWQRDLSDAGYGDVPDRAAMEHLHFYVACQDLEDELVRALGDQETEECIREQGDSTKLSKFSGQPKQAGKSRHDQLRAFLQVRDRKARYAPLLVDRLTEAALPDVLRKVLSNV